MNQLIEVELSSGRMIYVEVTPNDSDNQWREFSSGPRIQKKVSELVNDIRDAIKDIAEPLSSIPSKPSKVEIELAFEFKFGGSVVLVNGETKGAVKATLTWGS